MGLPWAHGTSFALVWCFRGDLMGLPWANGTSLVFPWDFGGASVMFPWDFHGTVSSVWESPMAGPMVLPWGFHAKFMGVPLPWESSVVLPWCFRKVFIRPPWDLLVGVSWCFHTGLSCGASVRLSLAFHGIFVRLPRGFRGAWASVGVSSTLRW